MKKTWLNSKICGKDSWFMIHQMTMGSTWILTLSGFIIIIVDSNRFSVNPHSILGAITFGLCFFQPIAAVFRPNPKSSSRPVFNFLHMGVGNLAHLTASELNN